MPRSLLLLALPFMACSRHSADAAPIAENIPAATLNVAQPTANSIYRNGDTLHLSAMAISTENIHGYDVYVRRANDSGTIWFEHIHDHNDTIRINSYWINDRTEPQYMEAGFTLYLDHDGHQLKKSVPFQVQ